MFYITEMSFKCLLDVPISTVLPRDLFKKVFKKGGAFFCEDS